MKKFLCLLLVFLMLASLCGCFKGDILSFGNNKNSQTQTDNNENDAADDIDDNDAKTDEKDDINEFVFGSVTNNRYKNEYLGLSCTLPSDWTFATEAEILQLNNIVTDAVGEACAAAIENNMTVYDMYATNQADGFSNIVVTIEKPAGITVTESNLKTVLKMQFNTYKTMYENMGYTDVEVYYDTVEIDGESFDGVKINAKIQGIDFYSTMAFFVKDDLLVSMGIGSLQINKSLQFFNYFEVE